MLSASEGEVKLLRLEDGDAPVLLDSFREEGIINFRSMVWSISKATVAL